MQQNRISRTDGVGGNAVERPMVVGGRAVVIGGDDNDGDRESDADEIGDERRVRRLDRRNLRVVAEFQSINKA